MHRSFAPLLLFLFLCATLTASADIVLTNYSSTNQLKIMPIGDSITDDCSIGGAWRSPLNTLLVTNSYPYAYVGRQFSGGTLKHEGYCGAVIAPPGVFGAHQYNATDNYLQKIVPDAWAVTNNRSSVMLILIGANDIGRGRNPYQVATNDMATLLNIIFSNSPSQHVGVAKITTLQNGTAGGLTYGIYATNVMIYNAVLQKLVNERRAIGQNVFLADMYSAVDYDTMFIFDHVHPDVNGLAAIAREWLARMETITLRTNRVTTVLINGGATWKYHDQGQDLGASWAQPNYDDSGWSNGIARLGYGEPAVATTVGFGTQQTNKYVTTYFRRPFVVPWDTAITNLNLRVARADGIVVYLNGQEIYRTNMPAGPITFTNLASSVMTIYNRHIFYPTNVPVNLPNGTNWIAAEVHLSAVTNTAMGFDMELIGYGYRLPAPSLSIGRTGNNVALGWPLIYGSAFSLYSTTNFNAANSWLLSTASVQTNGNQLTVTQAIDSATRFFRLQLP
jgi:lysophospholipase L1-like esterase